MVKRLSDLSPFLMMGFEFVMAVAIVLFLISSATGNFMALPAVLAAVILSLLCIPLIVLLYLSGDDPAVRWIFLGLFVYFIVQTVSGITWYLLPQLIDEPAVVGLAMLLMIVGYVPLLLTLGKVFAIRRPGTRIRAGQIVTVMAMLAAAGVAAFFEANVRNAPDMAYPAAIYAASIIADLGIIAACAWLIIPGIRTQHKAIFAILLATFVFSLAGDGINLASVAGILDGANLAQFCYSVTLIFITVALLLYSLTTVNVILLNRVNRELYDTRRLVGDLLLHTPDAMCVADPAGDMMAKNISFELLLAAGGRPAGAKFNLFRDAGILGDEISGQVEGLRQGQQIVVRGIKFTGRFYTVKMFPAYSSAGDIARYMVIAEDITELKMAEDALRGARDDLEARVQARTAELASANEQLKREIAERRSAEEKIRLSLREKEVLLKEVHHRVKNNLQIISSLFAIQAHNVRDEKCLVVMRESQDRIRSIAMIHEKLYQSPDIALIDFAQYTRNLADNLQRSYGGTASAVTLEVHIADARFDIDTAIPCGLIINELISNSLKYAFPGGRAGRIAVTLDREGDRYLLMVSDDGIGLPADIDVKNTASMGLQLVSVLVEQLGGQLTVARDGGTVFKVAFRTTRPSPAVSVN